MLQYKNIKVGKLEENYREIEITKKDSKSNSIGIAFEIITNTFCLQKKEIITLRYIDE